MKNIGLIAILILISAQFSCKKEAEMALKIQSFVGDVKIVKASGETVPSIGDSLEPADAIKTGEQSMADLLLGESGLIRVNQNSAVTVASLVGQPADDTEVAMDEGKIFVTMSKLKKGEFKVKTATAVIAVRGTSFRVTSSKEKARLDVVKGTVKVKPVKDGEVVEEVEETVDVNQTIELDRQTVAEIVRNRKKMNVMKLKQEEIKLIREEVKDIKLEIVDKLNPEAKKELKEEIIDKMKELKEERKAGMDEARKQMMMQKAQRQQALKDRAEQARLAEINRQKEEQARIEREKKRKEKERRDRASNIPTL